MPIDPEAHLAVFLRDVKERPDEDAPRLILADWLQDQGDPRGELIALDVRRDRLAPDDPLRDPLWEQERRLLGRHAFTWLGPLVDFVGSWEFCRGFLHLTARAERFLTDAVEELATSELFAWIEGLHLTEVRPPHLQRLAGSPILSAISILDLSTNQLGDDALIGLLDSPRLLHLRHLLLARNRIGTRGVVALAACPHLAGLQRLDLSRNRLGDAGAGALAESPHLQGLVHVDVRRNSHLTTAGMALLSERFGAGARW